MERNILAEVEPIFKEVFEDDSLTVTPATKASDVPQWDSLTHIELIVAVEKHFGVRFKSTDLEKLQNVGDLVTLIKSKLAA